MACKLAVIFIVLITDKLQNKPSNVHIEFEQIDNYFQFINLHLDK